MARAGLTKPLAEGYVLDHRGRRTLATRLADADRERFVGREAELAFLTSCLDDERPTSVVHITGPGGIGKSALLREVARRAADRGWRIISVDGRELGPAPGELEAMLRDDGPGARDAGAGYPDLGGQLPGPLLLLDSYEKMTALDGHLRRDLLPSLPEQAVVLIAGRGAPDPAWFCGGWEAVTARLDLSGLPATDAGALLTARGVTDERRLAIIAWAGGSPLALALAADAASADASWNPAAGPGHPEVLRSLIDRLIRTELRGIQLSALCIAAVARTTTPRLLRAVLPGEDADTIYQRLVELTVTEPLGDGITLHELVRKALLADLRLRHQELERDLRRRIIDHLYQRSLDDQPLLIIDMAHLVANPLVRWGFGWDGDGTLRIDSVRPDDADQVEQSVAHLPGYQRWWGLTRRFFEEAPDRVALARDLDDRICGYMACMSQATAPGFADTDPLIGPWLAHAREHSGLGDSVLWHVAFDFTGEGKVQAMLGMAGVLRSGITNPRFAYLPIGVGYPGAREFAEALGAVHLSELDAVIGSQVVECHRIDYGPGGLLAATRAVVYAELGLPAPAPDGPASQPAGPVPGTPVDLETVRNALKHFRAPRDLARSPLATGTTVADRAESVRRLVLDSAEHAFGDSASEKLLRDVLFTGYLEPMRSHEEAASKLCLSRAAYFRRLRTAAERLTEQIAERLATTATSTTRMPGPR